MKKIRILLVEDESIVALDIQNRLNLLGYEIVGHAVTGSEAIELARKLQPQLILMDIKLRGEMDGIDAAMIIHDSLSIPIVFLTAYSDQATLERAKITEPFGYLLKPFQKQELLIAIEIGLYKHEMTKRLRESENWLDTTMKSIGEGLLALDGDNRIKFMNAAAETLTGWNSADAIGLPMENIFREIISDDQTENRSLLEKKNGNIIPIEKQISVIRGENGVHQGTVLVFRDITHQVSYEEELITAKYVAEVANKAKSDFIANMTHELRTPLNSIIGMADIIKEWDIGGEQRAFVDILHTSAHSLLFLINSILDFSKIEAGKMGVGDVVFNFHEGLGEAAEKIGVQAGRKGLSFYVDIAEDVPEYVRGDQKLIDHILINLLGNAVKFTERGEVELSAAVARTEREPVSISIKVRDTGIGIPQEKLEAVFEPFSQFDGALTRNFGGTGLGLAITRRIVHILNGTISVSSSEGKGSEFTVTLPLVPAAGPGGRAARLSGLEAFVWVTSAKSRSILVRILRSGGAEVFEYDPGRNPVPLTEGERDRVFILDPETVGPFEKVLLEDKEPRTSLVPVVIASPFGYRYSPKSANPALFENFVLHEPFWVGNVKRAVQTVLNHDEYEAPPARSTGEKGGAVWTFITEIESYVENDDFTGLDACLLKLKSQPEKELGGLFNETVFRMILTSRKRDKTKLRALIEELKRNIL